MTSLPPISPSRQELLGLMARSRPERLAEIARTLALVEGRELRPPEIGTVMLQGRIGGTGAPFHMGEMTVTRCVMEWGGHIGHGHVQGRNRAHARHAALIDALWQAEPGRVAEALAPLAREEAEAARLRAAKAAATRVEFFTLMRGDD